jgi:hypothetical protein
MQADCSAAHTRLVDRPALLLASHLQVDAARFGNWVLRSQAAVGP